jgi:putative SOS response-associated peptidase YedK
MIAPFVRRLFQWLKTDQPGNSLLCNLGILPNQKRYIHSNRSFQHFACVQSFTGSIKQDIPELSKRPTEKPAKSRPSEIAHTTCRPTYPSRPCHFLLFLFAILSILRLSAVLASGSTPLPPTFSAKRPYRILKSRVKFTASFLMCGRFALNRGLGQLRAHVNARRVVANGRAFAPSNNIAPGDSAPVVAGDSVELMAWGFPLRDTNLFNARSETVSDKFSRHIRDRRCVVPADGFFEWTKQRQPFYFKKAEDELLFLAAFYTPQREFVILTRGASDCVSKVHDRMPIILSLAQIPVWQGNHWYAMLDDKPPLLYSYPVSRSALGSGRTGEECVRSLEENDKGAEKLKGVLALMKSEVSKGIRDFL